MDVEIRSIAALLIVLILICSFINDSRLFERENKNK